jgi:sodium pump decarboxylase gamma subunit
MSMVDTLGVGGTLIYGFKVAVIGMVVVFIGLIILIALIHILSAILKYVTPRKTAADLTSTDLTSGGLVSVRASGQDLNGTAEDENEVVAVITAVLAMLDEEQSSVRPMSRKAGESSPAWSMRGRVENMETR